MENNCELLRLRTIRGALRELKKEDPETCITYGMIRNLCEEEKIQCIKQGNRFIINYDFLIKYLFDRKD